MSGAARRIARELAEAVQAVVEASDRLQQSTTLLGQYERSRELQRACRALAARWQWLHEEEEES